MLTRGRRLWRALYRALLARRYRRALTHVGAGAVVEGRLSLRNEGTIVLGARSRLRSTPAWPVTLEAIAGATISIGADSFLNRGVLLGARERITIGRGVIIADRCIIYDTDWHPLPGASAEEIPTAPVTIEDGAWLGAGCIVLKGVTIGAGTVVGAGAVVTRDLPAHCIAAGNPARVIRLL